MRYFAIIFALFLTACTDYDKAEIDNLLDLRNQSISQKNIQNYAQLLSEQYQQQTGAKAIADMAQVFSRFDKVEMTSRDRVIQVNDENHAICEQTFILKVFADNEWRNIIQREQIKFQREEGHWKIADGL